MTSLSLSHTHTEYIDHARLVLCLQLITESEYTLPVPLYSLAPNVPG